MIEVNNGSAGCESRVAGPNDGAVPAPDEYDEVIRTGDKPNDYWLAAENLARLCREKDLVIAELHLALDRLGNQVVSLRTLARRLQEGIERQGHLAGSVMVLSKSLGDLARGGKTRSVKGEG